MILSFMQTFPWGDPTLFMAKIEGQWGIPGIKGHTFRRGDHWNPGDKIHFWLGSPRNPSKNPMPFNLADPMSAVYWYHMHTKKIVHRDAMPRYMNRWPEKHENYVPIVWATEEFRIVISALPDYKHRFRLEIGRKTLVSMIIDVTKDYFHSDFNEMFKWVTYRDGFDHPFDFMRWFWLYRESGKEISEIHGRVIHWNDTLLYDAGTASIFVNNG